MTGQRFGPADSGAALWRDDDTANGPVQRPAGEHGAAGVPPAGADEAGPGGRRRAGSARAGSDGDGRVRGAQASPVALALIMIVVPLLGAVADEAISSALGWVFAVCAVASAVYAVLTVSRPGLWWVIPAPPIIVAAITVCVEIITAPASQTAGKALATEAVRWGVHAFPAMAAAMAAALVTAVVRQVRTKRGGRGNRG